MEVVKDKEEKAIVQQEEKNYLSAIVRVGGLEGKVYNVTKVPFEVKLSSKTEELGEVKFTLTSHEFPKPDAVYTILKVISRIGVNITDQYKDEHVVIEPIKEKTDEELKQEILEFKSNPQNKLNAEELAYQIMRSFNSKWFTIDDLCKEFVIQPQAARMRIIVLKTFDLIAIKAGKTKEEYKIDLNHKAQAKLIDEEIKLHEAEIVKLRKKKESLLK